MKSGIIGLPQSGKTSLFKILTKGHGAVGKSPREAGIGIASVPDERLDKLAALYHPKKLTYATIEYVDSGPITPESLKDPTFISALRNVDCLVHVVKAFDEEIKPLDEIKHLEFELLVSDLEQIEKRLNKLEKDAKKMKGLEKEFELLKKSKTHLEQEKPLRSMDLSLEEKKALRGFAFLSEKPVLIVLNVSEKEVSNLESAIPKYGLEKLNEMTNQEITAVCGKIEAELAEMKEEEAAEFLTGFGLKESGLIRLIRKTYQLMGLISFFTAGEDECKAWTIPQDSKAVEAARAIHSDLAAHFIRAETIRWNELLEAGSESAAKARGILRLEGKEYIVQDGDVLHIRHSG
ncbi:MAG: redox-regulated ATPase YchF [Candidatus Eremiobacteraeota bacterium]|nr:redox-regulated ATPase YchF [Candidatus Eremiobacteraeota bacterium]MCL5056330.1 redox-regulated ATPase YchF [Bacillota bacterium]